MCHRINLACVTSMILQIENGHSTVGVQYFEIRYKIIQQMSTVAIIDLLILLLSFRVVVDMIFRGTYETQNGTNWALHRFF